MKRSCAGCGNEFEAKRSTAKYCGGTCRQRGNRKEPAERVELGTPRSVSLVTSTESELERAGRLDTVLGQQALALAQALVSPFTTGAGVASLSKELRAVMAEAMKGANAVADPLDELRQRRDRKRNAG